MASVRAGGAGLPLISIVIPAKDCAALLEQCLISVRAQHYPSFEIIVVDGHSSDMTRKVAGKYADRVIQSYGSVPASRNEGFGAASGRIFLSIDSDMVMESGLLEDVAACMGRHGALVIPEKGSGKGLIAQCKALEKECYLGNRDIESARAFSHDAFVLAGGYDAKLLYGEDRDLHCRVARVSGLGRTTKGLLHDTGGLSLAGCLRKAYRYGRSSGAFFTKKHPGTGATVSPLRVLFLDRFSLLARKPIIAVCLAALKTLESIAFVAGYALAAISPPKKPNAQTRP